MFFLFSLQKENDNLLPNTERIVNCYPYGIVDGRNFDENDMGSINKFYEMYSDDKYRCFHTIIQN